MKINLLIIFSFFSIVAFAQTGVTAQPALAVVPNANAELDIVSQNYNTGVIIPNYADADITNNAAGKIPNPANGLLIYNRDKKKFMYNAGIPSAPLWTFVGSIPAIADYTNAGTSPATYPKISTYAGVMEGEVFYDVVSKKIWYWGGSPLAWHSLQ